MKCLGCIFLGIFLSSLFISQVFCADDDNVPVPGQYYKLVLDHDGKCLDVSDPSRPDNGVKIHTWDCLDIDNQKFLFIPVEDGYYAIIAKYSGRGLDVSDPSNKNNGVAIHQWEYLGNDNQKWRLDPFDDGYHITAKYSDKCLDIKEVEPSSADYQYARQWDCLNYGNQKWRLEATGDNILKPLQMSSKGYGEIREDLPEMDNFKSNVPATTQPRLISEVYVPFFYVTDNKFPKPQDKIKRNPYYILRLEQYWNKEKVEANPGTTKREVSFEYTVGSTKSQLNSIEKILGKTLSREIQDGKRFSDRYEPENIDISLGVEGVGNVGMKTSGGETTEFETTNSNIYREDQETRETIASQNQATQTFEKKWGEKRSYEKGEKVYEAQYVLVNRFTLLRMDGSVVSKWDIKTDIFDYATYPK